MNRKLYETLRDLVDLAEVGVETLDAKADGPSDRYEVAAGNATLVIARYYVEEYSEQYRNGHLTDD